MDQLVSDRPLHVVAHQGVVQDNGLPEPGAPKLHAPVISEVPALPVEVPLDLVVRNVVYDLLVLLAEARFRLAVPASNLWRHRHRPEVAEPILPGELRVLREVGFDFLLELLVADQEVGDLLRHDERGYAEPGEPQEHHQQG